VSSQLALGFAFTLKHFIFELSFKTTNQNKPVSYVPEAVDASVAEAFECHIAEALTIKW